MYVCVEGRNKKKLVRAEQKRAVQQQQQQLRVCVCVKKKKSMMAYSFLFGDYEGREKKTVLIALGRVYRPTLYI